MVFRLPHDDVLIAWTRWLQAQSISEGQIGLNPPTHLEWRMGIALGSAASPS